MSPTAIATWLSRPIMTSSPFAARNKQSYCQHVDVAYRLFCPMGADRRSHAAAHGFGDTVEVAAAGPRQGIEGRHYGLVGDFGHRVPVCIGFGNAGQLDIRVGCELALLEIGRASGRE